MKNFFNELQANIFSDNINKMFTNRLVQLCQLCNFMRIPLVKLIQILKMIISKLLYKPQIL
jgi:hypothetical protein